MYHPGKVLKVFSPSNTDIISSEGETQALVMMWDNNLLTVQVHKNISDSITDDDIVLLDYRPHSTTMPVPRMVVTKILKGEVGTKTWEVYKKKFLEMKGKPLSLTQSPGQSFKPSHSYIG